MTHLDATETAARLPYSNLVPAIARAARELTAGALHAPERLSVAMESNGSLLCMPAAASDISITKIVTVHPQNAMHALPAIQGEVIVIDSRTGRRLLQLDGPTVTSRRTAAVTLLAIDVLASHRPRSALLIGTGAQAAAHADALVDYFDVRSFTIVGEALPISASFCDKLTARHVGVRAEAVDAATHESVVRADVVIALTTSRVPVVPSHLSDTTLAIGVGAFRPDMAELPPALLHARRVVVDYLNGARHEAGDLLQAGVNWGEVHELSQYVDGNDVRVPSVFKSVGHASWDLAAARVALQARQ